MQKLGPAAQLQPSLSQQTQPNPSLKLRISAPFYSFTMMARIALAALAMALLAVPCAQAVTFYSKETKTSPLVGFTGALTTVMNDVRSLLLPCH